MTKIDVEHEVVAFAEEVRAIRLRARACVERFRSTDDEDLLYLFAERLGGLGSVIVADLYELVLGDPSASSSHRYLAAWVAVRLGDRGAAVDHLCDEVVSGSSYALAAANTLVRLGLTQGRDAIAAAIVQVDPGRTRELVDWAFGLLELGGTLPASVRDSLESRRSYWYARAVLDKADGG